MEKIKVEHVTKIFGKHINAAMKLVEQKKAKQKFSKKPAQQ